MFISEIISILNAQRISERTGDADISCLLADSRYLRAPEGCLFFALDNKRNDGYKCIEELYEKGVRHFVVQSLPEKMQSRADADFLLVANPLEALRQLAAAHRKRFTIPVAAVTGDNGKTTVKEWLACLLAADRKVVKSPKSYHTPVGVLLSVWEIQPGDDIAVFEAGLSQPGDMAHNQAAIQPTIGVLTGIDAAVDEHFTTVEQKIEEALQLFTGVQQLVYCADHADVRLQITKHPALKDVPAFTWGTARGSTLRRQNTVLENGSATLTATYQKEQLSITIPFTDKAAIENAMHCWAFLLLMKYPHNVIAERMQALPAIGMRMELKEAVNNCSLISDGYPSDFHSLQMAVDFLKQQRQHAKKTVILLDFPPVAGRDENEWYDAIARLLAANNVSRIIGVGQAVSQHADKFTIEKNFFPDAESFLCHFPLSGFHDETILLKGLQALAFEKINNALQRKTYKTKLTINLDAIAHNLDYFRSKLTSGVRLMAMVKAFSYGSGSFEIANLLQSRNVDYLGVASIDEGVELRKAGIRTPVMVINPEEQYFGKMMEYHLEPEIYNLRTWHALLECTSRRPSPAPSPFAVHIKLDTGMHRLGFEEKDLPLLLQELKKITQENGGQPAVRIASVFSHLAASDNPQLDRFTHRQIVMFKRMSQQVQAACGYPVCRHILNSAGISRFPEAQFDMVRLGIGLYGIGVNETEQQRLKNISTLKTVIAQIRQLSIGETVGYNRSHKVTRDMRTGVIPIGYADGLPRRFGNGRGSVWVNDKQAPVIGNVCMDMCMIDLTGIPARENDEVIIFDNRRPVTEVAKILETIPYEVFTNISRRVKRIYCYE
ncbi:MAG: bifunctional UDP-N-acetylmuramoyl-tripeptide:D-alanyl-D-alanine ligase/alanine racemase [Prevotellaceae bacterium]|jgi:alanine racemase|nr:bifunctional UDP-N-acetylmuramoyl-tripeptide:D-alanyl-D-alanine ligase/alanine racemase [Prevotellaceae bacterium]